MIYHKTSGSPYRIPFEITLEIELPRIDVVSPQNLVDVTTIPPARLAEIRTIDTAIDLYIEIVHEQFTGRFGPTRKAWALQRYVDYLRQKQHSLLLTELRFEDGQGFLDSLKNAYDGTPLSNHTKIRYKSALRTFGRFLFQVGLIDTDMFFDVAWNDGKQE